MRTKQLLKAGAIVPCLRHMSACEIPPQVVTSAETGQSVDYSGSYISFSIINGLPHQVMKITADNPAVC